MNPTGGAFSYQVNFEANRITTAANDYYDITVVKNVGAPVIATGSTLSVEILGSA